MREDFKPLKTTWEKTLNHSKRQSIFSWLFLTYDGPEKERFCDISFSFFVGKPLFWITALHRLGMLCTRLRSSSGVTMWCQAWIIFSISSLLLGLFLAMITLILCHKFSIGLRSGDWAGQFIWATLWDCIHLFTNFARWQGALSSWHIQYSSGNKLRTLASNFVSNTAAYLVAFIIPSQMCDLPMPFDAIQPQIITLVGCFIVGDMHWGLNASWGLLQTKLFLAWFWIVKVLLSLNMTLSQSSLVQFKCSFAQAILAFLCFSDTFDFFFALLPLKPLRSNLFRIVDVDTSTPVLWRHS